MVYHSLDVLDYVFLVGSMLLSAVIGFYFTNKNKSIDAYMLGDRQMSVLPIAVSLMSSSVSGLTLLGASSEIYYQGLTYAFVAISILLSGPVISYTVLPVFYRMNELSLYKKRFGVEIKYIVTVIFMLQMIFFNSVVLYVPSMGLQSLLGIDKLYSILLIGIMCVIYSGIGGIKAVVWTDLFQALLMYAAVIVVAVMGTIEAGGFNEIFREAKQGGRLNLDGFFSLDLTTRHTFLGIIIGSTIKQTYLIGVNQVQIQRAVSLPTLRRGQWAFMMCCLFGAAINVIAAYLGMILYSAYRSCDPFLNKEIARRDAIIVHYVANRLYQVPGLRGTFIAGLFSATLSTLSSFANSMAALTIEDFIKPSRRVMGLKELDNSSITWLAKILSISFGMLSVLVAYIVDKANSRLLQATTTLFGAIGTPFLAAFMLGIYTRYINKLGIIVGFVVTLSFGMYMVVSQTFLSPPLDPIMPIYYSEQCAAVFNMTTSPKDLPTILEVFGIEVDGLILPPVKKPFSLDQISYQMLPIVQFVLTFVISSIVSLLTGGWNQQVDRRYLARMLHSSEDQQSYDVKGKEACGIFSLPVNYDVDHLQATNQRKRKIGVIKPSLQERQ